MSLPRKAGTSATAPEFPAARDRDGAHLFPRAGAARLGREPGRSPRRGRGRRLPSHRVRASAALGSPIAIERSRSLADGRADGICRHPGGAHVVSTTKTVILVRHTLPTPRAARSPRRTARPGERRGDPARSSEERLRPRELTADRRFFHSAGSATVHHLSCRGLTRSVPPTTTRRQRLPRPHADGCSRRSWRVETRDALGDRVMSARRARGAGPQPRALPTPYAASATSPRTALHEAAVRSTRAALARPAGTEHGDARRIYWELPRRCGRGAASAPRAADRLLVAPCARPASNVTRPMPSLVLRGTDCGKSEVPARAYHDPPLK